MINKREVNFESQKVKASQVLLRAAEMVDDFNRDEGDWRWQYGCHAVSLAAYELGASETKLLREFVELLKELPEVANYFELTRFPNSMRDVWFSGTTYREANFKDPFKINFGEHRVIALMMAAAIAESEGN